MDWASPFYLSFYPLCIRLYCQPFLIFPGHTGHQCDPGISVRFATFVCFATFTCFLLFIPHVGKKVGLRRDPAAVRNMAQEIIPLCRVQVKGGVFPIIFIIPVTLQGTEHGTVFHVMSIEDRVPAL